MKNWARRVLTSNYSSGKTWAYMDKVGIMHTGIKAFKHRTHVKPLTVPCRFSSFPCVPCILICIAYRSRLCLDARMGPERATNCNTAVTRRDTFNAGKDPRNYGNQQSTVV